MNNRRDFFKQMIGGVAAFAAVRTWPFRVYSFPADITIGTLSATSIRFLKMYDISQDRFISRLDVLYGAREQKLLLPNAAEAAYSITANDGLSLTQEEMQAFAARYSQGKFPIKLITSTIPKDGEGWIQKGWDVIDG